MSEYVTVNCIEACPRCKHKQNFVKLMGDTYPVYWLDCDYMSDIVVDELSKCNGMFEPKEENK